MLIKKSVHSTQNYTLVKRCKLTHTGVIKDGESMRVMHAAAINQFNFKRDENNLKVQNFFILVKFAIK